MGCGFAEFHTAEGDTLGTNSHYSYESLCVLILGRCFRTQIAPESSSNCFH